jgi:hypothetical protein
MDSGLVHCVHLVQAGKYRGNQRRDQIVDKRADDRILLGRTTHGGKGPYGPRPVQDLLDLEGWEIVGQAVVTQVISKRAFGSKIMGPDPSADAEVCLGRDREAVGGSQDRNALSGQSTGKKNFRDAFWQGHDGGQSQSRRAADKDIHRQGLITGQGLAVVRSDSAVDLIVEAGFLIRGKGGAADLDAVHA